MWIELLAASLVFISRTTKWQRLAQGIMGLYYINTYTFITLWGLRCRRTEEISETWRLEGRETTEGGRREEER